MPKQYKTKKYQNYEVSEISDSETIDEGTGRIAMGYGEGSETVDEGNLAPLMGPATVNIKTSKPLVRQSEAFRRAVEKRAARGMPEVSVDPNLEGDTELEPTVEEEEEAMKEAVDDRISFMDRDRVQDIRVITDGKTAVQLDPVSGAMVAGMSPEGQEEAGRMILGYVSNMRNAVQTIAPQISDPPVDIFVKSEGGQVRLTRNNVLDLKENGKPIDPAFFDKVAVNISADTQTSEEKKVLTREWCAMVKEIIELRRSLLEQMEALARASTMTVVTTQQMALEQISREYARYLSVLDANRAVTMQELGNLQGGLRDFSKFMSDGVTTLTRQHAFANQKLIGLDGALKEVAQNNLSHQQELYRGLNENFGTLMKMLASQRQDMTATQEQLAKLEKQIEAVKSQGGSLSQEQKDQMAEVTSKMTNMLNEIKEIREAQGEIKRIKEGLLETISAIRLLNEAAEGMKAKALKDRDLLISTGDGMQKMCEIVPGIKASADSVQDAAARYGKVIIENQEMTKAQLESLKSISQSLVSLERSTVNSQKVQQERQLEILGAIREAVGRQNLEDVKSLVKDELANEMKPPISMADITAMINEAVERSMGKTSGLLIDEIRNLVGTAAAGGAPPPPPPGGLNADAPVFVPRKGKFSFRETAALTPEAMEVEKNLALISAGGAPDPDDDDDDDDFDEPPRRPVGTGHRGKWARRVKKTHEVSKKILNWRKRAKLVGKVGSMVLGRERTAVLLNGLLGGGAMLGHVMSRRVANAIIASATGIGTIASAVLGILPAVKAISGYLARYLGMYDERSAETNRQLGRQTELLEQAIARLTELRGAGDGARFNQAPEVLRDLLNKIGEFKTTTVPPVLRYGRLERMTPEERFRSVISLAGRSKPISLRAHGFVEIKKNITDPALDNGVDYKKATVKRRVDRVKKIERRRTNDPLNKFFQGNW
nr:hypothetical protein [Prevotella sp.]